MRSSGGKAARYEGEVESGRGEVMDSEVRAEEKRGSGKDAEGAGQIIPAVEGQGAPSERRDR